MRKMISIHRTVLKALRPALCSPLRARPDIQHLPRAQADLAIDL